MIDRTTDSCRLPTVDRTGRELAGFTAWGQEQGVNGIGNDDRAHPTDPRARRGVLTYYTILRLESQRGTTQIT